MRMGTPRLQVLLIWEITQLRSPKLWLLARLCSAKRKKMMHIIVEGDSKLIIKAVQGFCEVPWRVKIILEDVRRMVDFYWKAEARNYMAPANDIPVGYKFHPRDEESVGYYLHNKVRGPPFRFRDENVIPDIDLYGSMEARDIWNNNRGQDLGDDEDLYFFTKLKPASTKGTGSRVARNYRVWDLAWTEQRE
ncbi:hypothetical protein ACFX11_030639 [Malus domestica]